jgi:glyoxylase-like metal-dependent hydrolase (beta-lactamase superfamily II)
MHGTKQLDQALKQLSERVWHLPAHQEPGRVQPSVGVVVGRDETVLIDAGNTPALADNVLAELNRIEAPPVGKVIYTHHHWDHVFGACVYGAEVIAHTRCRRILEGEAAKPWGVEFLAAEIAVDSSLSTMAEILLEGVKDWNDFRIEVPTVTFDETLSIEGDGFRLELEHVGGRHAEDSITVKVVGEGAYFIGDSFYPPTLRLNPVDKSLDLQMLRRFLAEDYGTYVDGHSAPIPRIELAKWLAEKSG